MLHKNYFADGQKVHELVGDKLTYFFKNGKVRAEGSFINGLMEGEWTFYRGTGGNLANRKFQKW